MTNKHKKLFLITLFTAALIERVVYDLGPNIELVTMAMILSVFYFGKKEGFWLAFAIIAVSDRIIGNSNIFLFTWTGFLIPALFSKNIIIQLTKLTNFLLPPTTKHSEPEQVRYGIGQPQIIKKISATGLLTLTGLSANIFFFLWTNFGVWLLDSFNMYPDTLRGLLLSYINGLPFLKMHLISTSVLLPVGFFTTELLQQLYKLHTKRSRNDLTYST